MASDESDDEDQGNLKKNTSKNFKILGINRNNVYISTHTMLSNKSNIKRDIYIHEILSIYLVNC